MAGLQVDNDILAGLAEAERDEIELEKHGLSSRTESAQEHELDGIHDGLVYPTEEERRTLRRIPDVLPWAMYCESDLVCLFHGRMSNVLSSDCVCRICGAVLVLWVECGLRKWAFEFDAAPPGDQ